MYDLSILIPARNEPFLARTVADIFAHAEAKTEVIVVLDGAPASPPLMQHPNLTVVRRPVSIGQRAALNEAAKLAEGKYVMKVDAHCAFDAGFDRKMLAAMRDDWTMVPVMRNLHAFDWVCEEGHRRYQGLSGPCAECGKPTRQDVVWHAKKNPQSTAYCFDPEPRMRYFKELDKRRTVRDPVTETMSLQGSCFMLTKRKYFELDICDETFGSWGSQGIEVAAKTWLSGGAVMCNRNTWYAHLFRTAGGDFGFPYEMPHAQVEHAKQRARELFFAGQWSLQMRPLRWLIEKFWPVPGWTEQDVAELKAQEQALPKPELRSGGRRGAVYYTHGRREPNMAKLVREQIRLGLDDSEIVSVSERPLRFGRNVVQPWSGKNGWLDLFERILAGLERSRAEFVFICEDDVLYHPSHFEFVPPRRDRYYYNVNLWKLRYEDGFCLKVDDCRQVSGLVADRELLLDHYRRRVERVRREGFGRRNGFEPGTRNISRGGYDDVPVETFSSTYPLIDIRHDGNATANRWRKDQYRNQKYTAGWTESDASSIPGWTKLPHPNNVVAQSAIS